MSPEVHHGIFFTFCDILKTVRFSNQMEVLLYKVSTSLGVLFLALFCCCSMLQNIYSPGALNSFHLHPWSSSIFFYPPSPTHLPRPSHHRTPSTFRLEPISTSVRLFLSRLKLSLCTTSKRKFQRIMKENKVLVAEVRRLLISNAEVSLGTKFVII